jgi:hypothetical protein
MDQAAFTSLRRKAYWELFRPKNPTAAAAFQLSILGTRGQYSNHSTTEAAVCDETCVLYDPETKRL